MLDTRRLGAALDRFRHRQRPGTAALVAERLVPDGSRRSEEEVERLRGRPAGIRRSQMSRRSLSDIMLDQLVR